MRESRISEGQESLIPVSVPVPELRPSTRCGRIGDGNGYGDGNEDGYGHGHGERGYTLVIVVLVIALMSILMTVAVQTVDFQMRREREAELIFRGEQYAHAIGLYQRKFAGAFPPSIDVLVQQKFLRKKYKDPMVPDGQFQVLYQTSAGQQPGQPVPSGLRPFAHDLADMIRNAPPYDDAFPVVEAPDDQVESEQAIARPANV